jgi:hypothetical protein
MKKVLLLIFALTVMLAPACTKQPASNNNTSQNSNTTPPTAAAPRTLVALITVTYTPGATITTSNVTIKDEYPDPDSPGNKRGHLRLKWKDSVEWQVFYRIEGGGTTPSTANVTIADFQRESPSGSATHPFLNTSPVALTATQGSATPARETRESRDKNGGDPPMGNFSIFKYSITVRINGLPEIRLDPRVVFDS